MRLALASLIALLLATSAQAATMVRWPAPVPSGDGRHIAAWTDAQDRVHVLRDADERDSVIATLPDEHCYDGVVGGGRLATLCRSPVAPLRLLDLSSDRWSAISDESAIGDAMASLTQGEDPFRIGGLGMHAVELYSLNRAGVTTAVFSLNTGVRLALPRGVHETTGVDVPGGVARICSPLSVRRYRYDNYGSIERLPYPVVYRRPVLLTSTDKGLLLERCGSRKVRNLGPIEGVPILTRRYIAWSDRLHLFVRDRATARTRRWRVPTIGSPPTVTGTQRRIWVDEVGSTDHPLVFMLDLGASRHGHPERG
jgi:hypothetical protein